MTMKKRIVLLLAIGACMFSCNFSSYKEAKKGKETEVVANDALGDRQSNQVETAKAKETAEWNHFKQQADSSLSKMESELKKLETKIEKASKNDKQKLKADYEKSKSKVETLKTKLHKRNLEFESDLKNFNNNISEKNQSFKREFMHDMDEFGKSFKDLFKENVK